MIKAFIYCTWLQFKEEERLVSQRVVGDTKFNRLLVQSKHSKSCTKSTLPKWTQLDRLDNRSYSTIQPRTYPTYVMKIGVWLSIWDFFDNLSQKSVRTAQQHSHQFLKKLNGNHWIGSSSPVTNPSGVLTNINLT